MDMKLEHLETNRLKLTAITAEDMKFIFSNLSKMEIKKILGHRSDSDFLKEQEKYLNGYASYNRSFILFMLTLKDSDKIIGRCGIHNWNKEHFRAEIGYVMEDQDYRQKSLMSEAVKEVIHYGFHQLQLNRLEALVGPSNEASIKIIEKNNFRLEGVLKQHYFVGGHFSDSLIYALLRSDYLSV